MITKEQFNEVWKDSSRESILNQFYYEHMQLREELKIIDELEKWVKEDKEVAMENFECGRCFNMFDILDKLNELKEGKEC